MKKILSLLVLSSFFATPAEAQSDYFAKRLFLGVTGFQCPFITGSGSPEGTVTAVVCSQYLDYTTGLWYRKDSGTGNTGWMPAAMITNTTTTSTWKSPVFIRNDAGTTTAGQNIGFWMQLGPNTGGNCNTSNPAANDYVAYYACMESSASRRTSDGDVGLYGINTVLTATAGNNIPLIGIEIDLQNLTAEGTSVPAAWATNGKVGIGSVLASTASTDGDGSAAFSGTINGTDTNDLWKYGFEMSGARTASFYARRATNIGNVDPTSVLFNDTNATNFLYTTGTHTMLLESPTVDIYGSSDGRMTIGGTSPTLDFYESDAGANAKYWRWIASGETLNLQTVNDAYSSTSTVMTVTRASENVGIGGITSAARLTVWGTGIQQVLAYDFSNYLATTVGSTGAVTIDRTQTVVNNFTYNISAGQFRVNTVGQDTLPALGVSGGKFGLMNDGGLYGFQMGISGATGAAWMQVQRVDGTATAYDLDLQPNGGNINIGADLFPMTANTSDIGADANKFHVLYANELAVQTLTAAEVISTVGGNFVVAPTTMLTADLAPATTTITVKHNNLANGDRIVMKGIGKFEWMHVTSAAGGTAGAYTYTVDRNVDGTGANQWYNGDAVMDSGTTGDGFINLYSESEILINGAAIGPAISGFVRTGTDWNQLAPRWTIGNLNGTYGYVADTYGAAFGNASAINVTVDATNGFRIRNGTTNKFTADTSGNLSIVGDLSVGTSGVIRSGATSYAAGTGFIVDYNGGTPRMRIGTAAGNRMTWDGTTLVIVGDVTATTGTIGGWVIGSDYLRSAATDVGMSSAVTGGDDIRFWAGDATPGSAEFSVTEAGVVKLTTVTASGSVTVGTGGDIRSGASAYATGTGYWLDYNGGTPRFRIGDPSGQRMQWDGTNVYIEGDKFALDSTNGLLFEDTNNNSPDDATVQWASGGFINSGSTRTLIQSPKPSTTWSQINMYVDYILMWADITGSGPEKFFVSGSSVGPGSDDAISLGETTLAWSELYVEPPSTTAAYYPLVIDSSRVYYKTDGSGNSSCSAGQYVDTVNADVGIFKGIVCSTPAPSPEVIALRNEVAELRRLVDMILGKEHK